MKPGNFAVMYRWRIHPGMEDDFIAAWTEVTKSLVHEGSFGSRLHLADDGTYVGYAQWPDADTRGRAFSRLAVEGVMATMTNATAESFPEVRLELLADFFV